MLTSNGYLLDSAPTRLGPLEPVGAIERQDRARLVERLEREGYLFLPGLLDPALVEGFRRYYFESLAGTGLVDEDDPGLGRAPSAPAQPIQAAELRRRLFREIVPGVEYEALCTHPSIRGWFAWFLGGDVHLHRRKIIRHTRPDEHTDPRTRGIGAVLPTGSG